MNSEYLIETEKQRSYFVVVFKKNIRHYTLYSADFLKSLKNDFY